MSTLITSTDMNNVAKAIHGSTGEEELKSVNRFLDAIDETVDWLTNDPEVLELMELIEEI